MSKSTRHYYASYHTHSVRFCNDVAYIVRFDTRAARDAYVDGETWDGENWHREKITATKARHLAPNAFRVVDDAPCMLDWASDGYPGEYFDINCF